MTCVAYPWIVIHDGTQGEMSYALECTRCGIVQKIVTPMSCDCLYGMATAFRREHKRCRLQIETSAVKT